MIKTAFKGGIGGGGVNGGGAAFDGNGNGLWIGNCEAKMVIDTSGGGW